MKVKVSYFKILLILITAHFLIGYIIYPIYNLLIVVKSDTESINFFRNKVLIKACSNSLLISFLSVLGSGLIGIYFAYSFQYKKIWLKPLLSIVILLPLAIPPMVSVMSFLFLLDDNGLFTKILGIKALHFTGWKAILAVHWYSFYPLIYLFVNNAIKATDSSIVEASYMLGASKTKTFFKVILPQLKPSIIGASMLTFMASMASFSAPFIFGGSTRFLTTEIYYAKINGDISLSAAYSMLLVIITIIPLLIFLWFSKKIPSAAKTKGTVRKNFIAANSKINFSAWIASFLFTIIIMLPLISLIMLSLLPDSFMMTKEFNFSFKNYIEVFTKFDLLVPFLNSIQTSLLGVAITLAIGVSVASLTRGRKNFLSSLTETVSSIPYGIPGTVIGLCLILSFNQPSFFSFNTILVGNLCILPVAYAIRNLPILTQSVKSGLHSIDPSIEEAAKSLGASEIKTWRSVTLPMVAPFILESSLLVFINSFGEFVATILLYTADSITMPIEIYAQIRLNNIGMAATYGVVIFLVVIGIIYFTRKLSDRYSY